MIYILIDGLWNLIIRPDGTSDPVKYNFHKKSKDAFRRMFDEDPNAHGTAFHLLDDVDIDKRIVTIEEGDRPVMNEMFILKAIESYNLVFDQFRPGILERKYKDKILDFLFAAYRNDAAYFERFGGMLSWLVVNKEDFKDIDGDYLDVLLDLQDYWLNGSVDENGEEISPGDGRERTINWINWGFRYAIRMYKRKIKNNFYKKSINHFLHFIYVNGELWIHHPVYYPENWFCNGRGNDINQMYGRNF